MAALIKDQHPLSPSSCAMGFVLALRLAHLIALRSTLVSPPEVDHYWKVEALNFMRENPGRVIENMWHKILKFFSATEIPINHRSP